MKKKEKYVKGVMKKSECDIWKEFTYGAWWLPFEKNGSNLAWQKKKKSKLASDYVLALLTFSILRLPQVSLFWWRAGLHKVATPALQAKAKREASAQRAPRGPSEAQLVALSFDKQK